LKKILYKIPGFRTNTAWKKLVAVIGYIAFIVYMIDMINRNQFPLNGNKVQLIEGVTEIVVLFIIPYVFFTDIFNIRKRIPIAKNHIILYFIISFIIVLILGVLISIFSMSIILKIVKEGYRGYA
jgi:hypothetical protein